MIHQKITKVLNGYLKPKVYLTPDDPMVLNVLSKLSQMACFYRIRFNDKSINYFPGLYCISFMNAGGGKDRPNDIIDELTKDIDDKLLLTTEAFYDDQIHKRSEKANALKGAEKTAYIKENPIDLIKLTTGGGTSQGIHKSRIHMNTAGFGSTHFHETEFMDYITTSKEDEEKFLSYIKKAYQHGFSSTPSLKTEKTLKDIKGVPMTMFAHSAIGDMLTDTKLMGKFNSFWKRGYNRRCIICYVEDFKKPIYTEEEKIGFNEKSKSNFKQCKKVFEDFYDLISSFDFDKDIYGKTLTISNKAYSLFCKYENECIEKGYDLKNEIQLEELEDRKHRAMMIAGIYALLDGNFEVSEENFSMAIDLIEYYAKQFDRFFEKKDELNNVDTRIFETLFDFISKNPGISKRGIFKARLDGFKREYGYFNNQFRIIIEEFKEHCDEQEMVFIDKEDEKGYSAYYIEKVDKKQGDITNKDILLAEELIKKYDPNY